MLFLVPTPRATELDLMNVLGKCRAWLACPFPLSVMGAM